MNHYPGKNIDSTNLENEIFEIKNEEDFAAITRKVFTFQYYQNPVYKKFCDYLGIHPGNLKFLTDIPYLPIDYFKTHQVLIGIDYELLFKSSGTTGMQKSSHYLKKFSLYEKSYQKGFQLFYGDPQEYCIMALLPGYWDNKHSSLVTMADGLIRKSNHPDSGFYLYEFEELQKKLVELDASGQKVLLLGVSFALLDLAEKYPMQLNNTIIMETGGMKGRRKEIVREELHEILKSSLGVNKVHSEYGMAELLSQAYSKGAGKFRTPPWMKILIRDTYDPFDLSSENIQSRTGGINIIDLANIYSCSFIETKDIGNLNPDGTFEVMGRFDYSDIRGCNLMVL